MAEKLDNAEKGIRLGCGFVAGGTLTFFTLLTSITPFTGLFWTLVIGCAVGVALLALWYGDDAWNRIL
jgi:hypothetical protein